MYKVISGDTWYKIVDKYDYKYDVDSLMNLIVYVNNLPNNDLHLGERMFYHIYRIFQLFLKYGMLRDAFWEKR